MPLGLRALACAVLVALYVAFTGFVATGAMSATDHQVQAAMNAIWWSGLRLPFIGFAFLGGLELTTFVTVVLAVYLWRAGFRSDLLALLALPIAEILETVYKMVLYHPGVPPAFVKGEAPSLTDLFERAGHANSYPSGHLLRTVVVYGLVAFVVYRLARRRWLRVSAAMAAVVLVVLMAFNRLYLEVHWESDVIGSLLLGGVCLLVATLWLDRPRPA
jgi:membrane-associated phospholipid phosphatase